jgi:hypothetical protein
VHNGVFAAACVYNDGRELQLTVDAFGVSPLYYRTIGELVAFSTHSQLLRSRGDTSDRIAALQLLSCGWIPTCRTLNQAVRRLPPGQSIRFTAGRTDTIRWYDLGTLPAGTEEPTEGALLDVEAAFQQAIDRILKLPSAHRILPLSSGDDSRRILAALQHRRLDFSAVTVRVFQDGDRDLDARWATAMAQHFGFHHKVIESPLPTAFSDQQLETLRLFDFLSREHAWMLPMTREWTAPQSVVLDGLAGDVVCWAGFLEEHLELSSPPESARLIAEHYIVNTLPRFLSERFWSSPATATRDLTDFLSDIPTTPNRPDLCFLRARTRGGPGLALQQLSPSGNVPVYPYLELNHVRTALRISPAARLREPLQGRCLREFWPDFYRFPGARRPPPGVSDVRPDVNRALRLAGLRSLQHLLDQPSANAALAPMLSAKGRLAAIGAQHVGAVARRAEWWLMPCLILAGWERAVPALNVTDGRE